MASTRNYGPAGAPGQPAPAINTPANNAPPVLPAQVVGNVTTEQVVQNPSLSSAANPIALVVPIPSNSILEQQPFEITASGYIKAGAAGNVTANLYEGSSTTVANNVLLKSSGAEAFALNVIAPFWIKARAVYDSVSGKLAGTVQFLLNGTLVAEAAFTNTPTGINDTNNPVVSFVISFTFSVANANNLVNVKDFAINF